MDPYVVTLHLGLGMGVIGPSFYISLVIWDPIHLFFFLLLNREINRHPPDTSNRSNWMSDSGLYDRSIEILQHSTFVIYSIHHTR
ncbi:hypothetical protein ERO13_D01G101852v2 [Gossypium hirsutum]|nr:hypothetical protein ERO13_D01G101852v2 [Gossypium hirsutum]